MESTQLGWVWETERPLLAAGSPKQQAKLNLPQLPLQSSITCPWMDLSYTAAVIPALLRCMGAVSLGRTRLKQVSMCVRVNIQCITNASCSLFHSMLCSLFDFRLAGAAGGCPRRCCVGSSHFSHLAQGSLSFR